MFGDKWPVSGFAISSLEFQPKKIGLKPWITKGLATWHFLGLILSMVTVGAYGGPRVLMFQMQQIRFIESSSQF